MKLTKKAQQALDLYRELTVRMDAMEKQKKEMGKLLLAEWERLGVVEPVEAQVKYMLGDEEVNERVTVGVSVRNTSKIEPDRLLEKGVQPNVIKYATVTKSGEPFVSVRVVKEKGKGSEEV